MANAKVIKLTDNNGNILLPIADSEYAQHKYTDNSVSSAKDAINYSYIRAHDKTTYSSGALTDAAPAHGGSVTVIGNVKVNSDGHVEKLWTQKITLPSDNDKQALQGKVTSNVAYTYLASGGEVGFYQENSGLNKADITFTYTGKKGIGITITYNDSIYTHFSQNVPNIGLASSNQDITNNSSTGVQEVITYVTVNEEGHVTSYGKTKIYSSDKKVAVASTSDDKNYPLIFKYSNNNTAETTSLRYDSDGLTNAFYNPNKNTLTVTKIHAQNNSGTSGELQRNNLNALTIDNAVSNEKIIVGSSTAYVTHSSDYSITTTAPTSSSGDSTVPTSKAVYSAITSYAGKALHYAGTITGGSTSFPTGQSVGATYYFAGSCTINGTNYESGDMAIYDGSNWNVVNANWTAEDKETQLKWGKTVTLAEIGGVTIDARQAELALSSQGSGNVVSAVTVSKTDTTYTLNIAYSSIQGNQAHQLVGTTTPSVKIQSGSATGEVKFAGDGTWIGASYTSGGNLTISHSGPVVVSASYGPPANKTLDLAGSTFTVPKFTVDARGHVTAASNVTYTMPTHSNQTHAFTAKNEGSSGNYELKLSGSNSIVNFVPAHGTKLTATASSLTISGTSVNVIKSVTPTKNIYAVVGKETTLNNEWVNTALGTSTTTTYFVTDVSTTNETVWDYT